MLGNYRPDSSGPSPFTPRLDQETLSNNVTKVFVLLVIIFSSLLLISPRTNPLVSGALLGFTVISEGEPDNLRATLLLALSMTSFVVMYILYSVVKKGSKIGRKIVVHPQLIPEVSH